MGQHNSDGRATRERRPHASPGAPSLLMALGAALVVTAVILCAVALVNHQSRATRHQAFDLAPTLAPLLSPSPSADSPKVPTVLLRWTGGASWIRIRDGQGAVLLVGNQAGGTVKSFTGPRFSVELANAGAVTVSVKGASPHVAGAAAQPAQFTVVGP